MNAWDYLCHAFDSVVRSLFALGLFALAFGLRAGIAFVWRNT